MHTTQQNKAVIFGAGNIGRSFIGNIFASNGYQVTFIDANQELVDQLNRQGSYPVLIKRNHQADEKVEVSGIRALHSSDGEGVITALKDCSYCATAVGQNALQFVVPQIAEAVKQRTAEELPPLDIIIAENIRNGADFFRDIFRRYGLDGNEAGLVETSIGKMVPIMTGEDLADDPLVLHAEEYNTLILDRKGFMNTVPAFPEIKAVDNIAAWVDRKLFIHNLGHAACAYFGFKNHPGRKFIAEIIEEPAIKTQVRAAMDEAAAALLAEYPEEFTQETLDEHIDDLLFRFGNKSLGDTVFRVGRDLYRKLNRNDRILGAAALCIKHGLPCDAVTGVFQAALGFEAADENGRMFKNDIEFHSNLQKKDIEQFLQAELGLNPDDDILQQHIVLQND